MNDTQTSTAFHTMAKLPKIEGARPVCCAQKTQPHLVDFLAPSHICCICSELPVRRQRDVVDKKASEFEQDAVVVVVHLMTRNLRKMAKSSLF